ncbi:tetrathionate reductase family octaheme c-type cytochrome [Gaoshiqia sp. Z1-71]|uniref:tetrathionate reductase family octaheme c-type cytochrome n=1 Tax=Gaoshiqia hydrogeniformans TaxID=3290090 RepID=UPI003BF8EF7F
MNRSVIIVIGGVIVALILTNALHKEVYYNLKLEKLKQEYAIKPVPSADHSKFEILQQEFKTPQDVTEACISCHTERHKEIMASAHWNWERVSYVEGRGIAAAGKRNVINNFCIGAQSNEQSCAKCHIGYGMTNDHFDFNNARNVDCMVCHDNSDEYLKGTSMAGFPDRSVNLAKVAQSVGQPTRHNCGSCHFNGGGGNNVKHGDLEQALLAGSRDVDVHMAVNGINLECTACHTAENHQILGKMYSVSSTNTQRATCEQCHTNTPHFDPILNRHNAKVSCQACHIPEYAKVNATKMAWKWSEAGKLKDGQPYQTEDETGNHDYMTIKGSFKWEKNVKPDYVWFNGTAGHYLLGDKITSEPLVINPLNGSHDDGVSKIIPVKIHRGDQIYDRVHKTLIQPKLWSDTKGDSAYWMDLDWDKAAAAGMKIIGLPYSGEYGFIETEMYWPVNHMVSPKEQAVSCAECHTRSADGRLAGLTGFYLPGRDYNKPLDIFGFLLFFGSLAAVVIHAAVRIIVSIKNKQYETKIIDYDTDN